MIIQPADRTLSVKEYYFSIKNKEMASLNVERKAKGLDPGGKLHKTGGGHLFKFKSARFCRDAARNAFSCLYLTGDMLFKGAKLVFFKKICNDRGVRLTPAHRLKVYCNGNICLYGYELMAKTYVILCLKEHLLLAGRQLVQMGVNTLYAAVFCYKSVYSYAYCSGKNHRAVAPAQIF